MVKLSKSQLLVLHPKEKYTLVVGVLLKIPDRSADTLGFEPTVMPRMGS